MKVISIQKHVPETEKRIWYIPGAVSADKSDMLFDCYLFNGC